MPRPGQLPPGRIVRDIRPAMPARWSVAKVGHDPFLDRLATTIGEMAGLEPASAAARQVTRWQESPLAGGAGSRLPAVPVLGGCGWRRICLRQALSPDSKNNLNDRLVADRL